MQALRTLPAIREGNGEPTTLASIDADVRERLVDHAVSLPC